MNILNAGVRGYNPTGVVIHNDAGSNGANVAFYNNWLPNHNPEDGFAHVYIASDGRLQASDFSNMALNRQYSGTAIIAGGRYFELINEQVVLIANTSNYITVNIDLSNQANPITISNESADLSNTTDINKNNGLIEPIK